MTLFGNKMHYYEEHKNWDSLYPHLTRNSRPIWGGHFLRGWLKWIRCSLWPRGIYNLVEAKQRQAWSIIPLWAGQWGPRADVLTGPLPVDCVYFPGLLKPSTTTYVTPNSRCSFSLYLKVGGWRCWQGPAPLEEPSGAGFSPDQVLGSQALLDLWQYSHIPCLHLPLPSVSVSSHPLLTGMPIMLG